MNAIRNRGVWPLLLAVVVGGTIAARADVDVPRYHLTVGQEITYQTRSTTQQQGKAMVTTMATTLWVVRQNPDKSYRLVIQQRTELPAGDAKNAPPVVTLRPVDLLDDGNLPEAAEAAGQTAPEFFPPLPATAAAMGGWDAGDEADKTSFKALRQRDRNEFLFEAGRSSTADQLFGISNEATYHYDWKQGLIARVEVRFSQEAANPVKGNSTTDLTGVATREAAFIGQLATESDLYFKAGEQAAAATTAASLDPAQTQARLDEAANALKAVADKITLPAIKEQLDGQIKAQPEAARFAQEQAKHRAALLATPAMDWTTTDLAGRPVDVKQLRGKTLVLGFWAHDVVWCIKELPVFGQLAEDLKNDPVVVLGMNTDQNPQDASAVLQQLNLNLPTLKADPIAQKLQINALPTVLVVDGDGKIRGIFEGYAPNLRQGVAEMVKGLKNPTTSPAK